MLRGIYTSVSSMLTLQARQSVITNNLANINTFGYKEETLVSKNFDEVTLSNNDNYINGASNKQILGSLSFGVSIDDTVTSYEQGTHISTENNSDFALDGNGFFQVQDTNGKTFFTRDGSFKVNSQGYLVTNAGHNVMGLNKTTGNIEPINIGNDKIHVTPNNNISVNGIEKYSFNIVDFDDYDTLKKVGDNLYSGENPTQANKFYIKQGYLETSNVDYINTTALLMETVKEFEANQKVIQTIDSTLSKIANEIGTVR
ncbi:flagellar hook-basal body complex protein [Romboutsia sp.]|uniref:flagellar hook-basal body complex protein n=1 Tax=Romboutsia sp. TaxID=1965302 RepID=UPI002CED6A72|nr:flagellar hook-basal body complex protein [Romboutsia sp.]HSQ87861.1 flagellar hook-basal body complex protein [Romboutsia sp.]